MATERTARQLADEYLSNPQFHQEITFNAGDKLGELKVSYGEFGVKADADSERSASGGDVPTILFTPGMFGSRYNGVVMHAIALKHRVRILVPDR